MVFAALAGLKASARHDRLNPENRPNRYSLLSEIGLREGKVILNRAGQIVEAPLQLGHGDFLLAKCDIAVCR